MCVVTVAVGTSPIALQHPASTMKQNDRSFIFFEGQHDR